MVRHVEIDPRQAPRSRRRMWLFLIIAILLAGLLTSLVIIVRLTRVIPDIPPDFYANAGASAEKGAAASSTAPELAASGEITGALMLRLDTADQGLDPVLMRLLAARLKSDELDSIRNVMQTVVYPRIWFFARGGQDDVHKTRLLAVAHIKRLAVLIQRALKPALDAQKIKPGQTVSGVGVYPVPAAGWLAATGRGLVYSNDLAWASDVVARQEALGEGRVQERTEPAAAFARRCASLDTIHEARGLFLMTPERRRLAEELLKELVQQTAPLEIEDKIVPFLPGLMAGVEVAEAEVDLRPDGKARVYVWLEVPSAPEAKALAQRWDKLREAAASFAGGFGVRLENVAADDSKVSFEIAIDNTGPLLAAAMQQ